MFRAGRSVGRKSAGRRIRFGWQGRLWIMIVMVLAIITPSSTTSYAATGTWQSYTYNGSAGSLPYYVYTPASYHVGERVPLIVMLHGCTQTAADFAAGTQMDELADQKNFIVIYPQQTSQNNTLSCWDWFEPANQSRGVGEPALIAGIVQTVENNTSEWTIDKTRVYVAGLSAGAAMAVIMGATYPDMFAAIGVHSGLEYQAGTDVASGVEAQEIGGPDPMTQGQIAYDAMGRYARVVPTIVFQGTSDTTVAPINGTQVIEQWMETDSLTSGGTYDASYSNPSTITNGQVPGGHSYTEYTWNDKQGKEIEEYWLVNGMGHAWSGGSSAGTFTDPLGPNATLDMYTFFMNYRL
jgi:poly(hydroxyalkanoate) depolymerase family esterase